MDMEEWHYINVVKPKQDWARVSQEAKRKKVLNKKSKRDIEREDRIEALGGKRLEVTYGVPLEEEVRQTRMELEWDLKYPNRKNKNQKPKKVRGKGGPKKRGAEREPEDLLDSLLKGAKSRAKKLGLPFDLEPEDLEFPKHCPVLGLKFSWSDTITNETPSIDRMVPELGYVKGNCTLISMKANRLKNNATEVELEALLAYMKRCNQ